MRLPHAPWSSRPDPDGTGWSRRRVWIPLLVVAVAAVIYVMQEEESVSPVSDPGAPRVDLRVPGMEMRAVPPTPPPLPPPLRRSESSAMTSGR